MLGEIVRKKSMSKATGSGSAMQRRIVEQGSERRENEGREVCNGSMYEPSLKN